MEITLGEGATIKSLIDSLPEKDGIDARLTVKNIIVGREPTGQKKLLVFINK